MSHEETEKLPDIVPHLKLIQKVSCKHWPGNALLTIYRQFTGSLVTYGGQYLDVSTFIRWTLSILNVGHKVLETYFLNKKAKIYRSWKRETYSNHLEKNITKILTRENLV